MVCHFAIIVAYINHHMLNLIRAIGLMSRVFANGPGDLVSISARVIPKIQKMVLDATLLNIQHCEVNVEQSSE